MRTVDEAGKLGRAFRLGLAFAFGKSFALKGWPLMKLVG